MKKKTYLIFALLILSCVFCVFAGCNGCGEKTSTDDPEIIEPIDPRSPANVGSIGLNKKAITLERLETFQLVSGSTENQSDVSWRSEDEKIATVNGGLITAIGKGKVRIYGEYDGTEEACVVIVEDHGLVPVIVTNLDGDCLNIAVNDDFLVKAGVTYNGKVTEDAELLFEIIGNDQAVTMENTTIKGGTVAGTAQLIITAKWRGTETVKKIEVKVVNSLVASLIERSELTLYALSLNGEETEKEINLSVSENGEKLDENEYTIEYGEYDEKIIDFDGKTIGARSAGSTELYATVTSLNTGFSVNVKLPVTINRVTVDGGEKQLKAVDLSKNDYFLNKEEVFDDFSNEIKEKIGEIVKVYDVTNENDAVELSLNKETGKIAFGDAPSYLGERKWNILTDTVSFTVNTVAATKIIATAEEFAELQTAYGASEENYFTWGKNCYFILSGDIDFNGATFGAKSTNAANEEERGIDPDIGFLGVFDGRGYAIKNFTLLSYDKENKKGSLFGNIGKSGTIKNLTVKDYALLKSEDSGTVSAAVAWSINQGTLENINVIYTGNAVKYHHNYLAFRISAVSTVKNVNIYSSTDTDNGIVETFAGGTGSNFSDVNIVINGDKLTPNAKYDGELKEKAGINYLFIKNSRFVWGKSVYLTGKAKAIGGLEFLFAKEGSTDNQVYGAWVTEDGLLTTAVGCEATLLNVTGRFTIAGELKIFNIPVTEKGEPIPFDSSDISVKPVSGDTGYELKDQQDGSVFVQLQPSTQASVYEIELPKIDFLSREITSIVIAYNAKGAKIAFNDNYVVIGKDAKYSVIVKAENGNAVLYFANLKIILSPAVANGREGVKFNLSRGNDKYSTVVIYEISALPKRTSTAKAPITLDLASEELILSQIFDKENIVSVKDVTDRTDFIVIPCYDGVVNVDNIKSDLKIRGERVWEVETEFAVYALKVSVESKESVKERIVKDIEWTFGEW